MVITLANLANIRGGVGTGDEIYLDGEKTQTGWANMLVIKFIEN